MIPEQAARRWDRSPALLRHHGRRLDFVRCEFVRAPNRSGLMHVIAFARSAPADGEQSSGLG
jgi:hypothetical protein